MDNIDRATLARHVREMHRMFLALSEPRILPLLRMIPVLWAIRNLRIVYKLHVLHVFCYPGDRPRSSHAIVVLQ